MLSRTLRISMIEEDIVWGDKAGNLKQLERAMLNIPDGTDVVVLPEMFSTGVITDRELADSIAERNTGETISAVQRLAREHNVAFVGSFLARTAGQLYNRAFFIEPNGDETFYDKRHLFAPAGEDKVYNRGTRPAPVVRFRGMNIKVVVCYDLRFPVFCRNVNNEYDVLLVVANWPLARVAAWRQLLIARAIENECYVCGVNRCGSDDSGVEYGEGTSLIIDYKGKVIAERGKSPIIAADLSPAPLEQFREKFPVWKDGDTFSME